MKIITFGIQTTLPLWIKDRNLFIETGFQIFGEEVSHIAWGEVWTWEFDPEDPWARYVPASDNWHWVEVSLGLEENNIEQLRLLDHQGFGKQKLVQEWFKKAGYIQTVKGNW